MVSINEAFPNKYLKADDLQGREVSVVISGAEIEEVGQKKDRRLVLYFRGKEKGMVCNKTNAGRIAFFYGDDTEGWTGQPIILYAEMVEFQGKPTWGLRVKVQRQPGVQQQQRAVDPQFVAAREQVRQHLNGSVVYTPPTTQFDERNPPPHTGGGPIDEDIPFGACKD